MNITLWIIQALLAALFGMAGVVKTFQPVDKLGAKMTWVKRYSTGVVRLVGVSELLAAIGLIVPQLTGIVPALTVWAAIGLCLVMVLAALDHLKAGEYKAIGFNAVLFALAALVAYGRAFA